MKAGRNNVLMFFLISLLIFSCSGDKKVFEDYRKFDNLSWNRFNFLKFEMNVEDVTKDYDIYINVRHLPEAPYKKMELVMSVYTPSGDMRTGSYTLDFKDTEGHQLSKCMGDYCDLLAPLRKSIRFYEAGKVRIEIENKYTKLEMPGILEVGIIVKEAKGEE